MRAGHFHDRVDAARMNPTVRDTGPPRSAPPWGRWWRSTAYRRRRWAQSASDTVVVTGSARAQRALDSPFAISSIDAQALRDAGPMVNLSEAMAQVPGMVVNNRNNYAQDLQISSRGFGARATFGVRGLRLYTDGIPATMPDGQGQVAHFDLAGAQRIEVLRGPFSALYGNSSGGVIALFTAPVDRGRRPRRRWTPAASACARRGWAWRRRWARWLGGALTRAGQRVGFEIDGFRPQSAADRQLGNMRAGLGRRRGQRDLAVLRPAARTRRIRWA